MKNAFNPDVMQTIIEKILFIAKKEGASQAEVDIAVNKGFSVTVRNGNVETVEYNQDKMVSVTVYFGNRLGSASLSDLRPDAIQNAVKAACNIARFTDHDDCSGLADKELLAFNYPKPNLYYPWDIQVTEAIEIAKLCEAHGLAKDKRIVNSEGATLSTLEMLHGYGNSHGFTGMVPVTRHELSCVLIAEQNKEMQRDYDYTLSSDPELLNSPEKVAEKAAKRSLARLGAKRLTTRRVPVIFAPEEARGLLGHFVAAISGGNLYRKASFLLDHLNQPVFPSHIQMDERPHLAKLLGSSPFDDDGVLTKPNQFIKNGILNSYALGVYSGRKLDLPTTGNAGGVHNLFISTGDRNFDQLLDKMGTGLVVTELMGQGVNIVTGDYSRGCSGFWVENGKICYPVEEITIAGNLKDIFGEIVEVGSDVDTRGNIQTGSILISHMMVAGD